MIDKFVHLHVHSTYSFTDGFGLPEQYVKRAKEIGQPALGVTDHGNVSSHFKWYKNCKANDITPILGCEMYLVEKQEDVRERDYNHITVLVQNNVGYRNLLKLVTKSWNENFYYKPRITFQDLFDNQEGLIVLSGCLSSPSMELIKAGKLQEAVEQLRMFKEKIKNFYIEFMPTQFKGGIEHYKTLIHLYESTLKKEGFKGVVTNDCHYVEKHQSKTQEVLLCVQSRDLMSNPQRWKFDQDDYYLKSRQEMEDSMKFCFPESNFSDEMDETVRISEMIDFTFPTASPMKFPIEDDKKYSTILKKSLKTLKELGLENDVKYKERLLYELDIINKKNFLDYFLVIEDLVNWAKKKNILVGPARGSAAGSLACFLLHITDVDPLKYDLLFERFIDINREDLPDIDIDFQDDRRHEVKEYLAKKYGSDKVGNLPVFIAFKGKSSLDRIGTIFEIPFSVVDSVKSAIVERSGGDSRASFTLMDTFESTVFELPREAMKKHPEFIYAVELEGQIKSIGQHAAGVIISNEPLTNFCAIYKIKGEQVISLDYKDASSIGLLKIDLLGISALTAISKCIKIIEERHGEKIELNKLPLDDKKTYQGFTEEKMFGVFQFDGQAVNQVTRQIKPKDFNSLSAINALARPGPLNGGSTTSYIMRRAGKEKIVYPHKVMEDYTKETYGVVLYQEQVMKTMREVGKMSWKDTSEIRKLISRSQGVERFNDFKDKFSIGAKENGMNGEQIDKIWDAICTFGSWAFNKSHSVSYSLIAYWMMWLKVHYPVEFYSSILFSENDEDKEKKIVKEYKRAGLKVLPISINKSGESFTIDDGGLRVGFKDIKGIGETYAKKLIKYQPYDSYFDVINKLKGKGIGDTKLKLLANIGAFDELKETSMATTLFGETQPVWETDNLTFQQRFQICPWDMDYDIMKQWTPFLREHADKFKKLPLSIEQLKEMNLGFNSDDQIIMGIIYDKNLRDVREVSTSKGKNADLSKYVGYKLTERAERLVGQKGYISPMMAKRINSEREGYKLKEGMDYTKEQLYEFANFVIEDDTDFITVRLSHLKFPEYGNLIFEKTFDGDVVIIKGKMGSGIRMFFANKIINLNRYKEELDAKSQQLPTDSSLLV